MSETHTKRLNRRDWASAWVSAAVVLSAAVTLGYWAGRGLSERDTEAMESPLMLAVARQLDASPRKLYGPYDETNHLVLIHAPLYYRAAALAAWPMVRGGMPSIVAARIAGRLISAACLAATLAAAYRLGRLGGLPRRAGWWSALLVAASPVLAGQPVAVRPDMAGVALQSWGVALALESLVGPRRRLGWASFLFGLAACVKQHLVAGWAVTVLLAVWRWVRGRLGVGGLARAVVPGVAVAGLIYAAEWLATGGRVWEAAFVAPSNIGRVHPGTWDQVLLLFIGIVNRSAGTVAVLTAAAFVAIGRYPGALRAIAAAAGSIVSVVILGVVAAYLWRADRWTGALTFVSLVLAALVALPPAAFAIRSATPAKGVDATLWACLIAELGTITLLSHSSDGAWINYGIPAAVFAAVLGARALTRRALDPAPPAWVMLPAILAPAVIVISSVFGLAEVYRNDLVDRATVEVIHKEVKQPRSAFFFAERPGLNRLDGRLELVYDYWLYPVFESARLAEPRSRWLRRALATGPVRAIVQTSEAPLLEGAGLDLRRLGYVPAVRLAPYFVWVR